MEYTYDYIGRRVKKTVYTYESALWSPTYDILFLYDGWNLVKEITTHNGQAPTNKYYVWGLDLSQSPQGAGGIGGLLTAVEGSLTHYYCYDSNGNVGQLINVSDGSVSAHYEYDPFGNSIVSKGTKAENNPYRFSTKYFDGETELYYYGYRYFTPQLGRWLNRDPIEEDGGLNLYGFVRNSPVVWVDAYGLFSLGDKIVGWIQQNYLTSLGLDVSRNIFKAPGPFGSTVNLDVYGTLALTKCGCSGKGKFVEATAGLDLYLKWGVGGANFNQGKHPKTGPRNRKGGGEVAEMSMFRIQTIATKRDKSRGRIIQIATHQIASERELGIWIQHLPSRNALHHIPKNR